MAQKEVSVIINGKEYVSKAAKEAETGLTGFASFMDKFRDRLLPVVDVTKLVEWAVQGLSAAFQAAKTFVLDSVGAYDRYLGAQVKLAAQSKLTGMSMQDMGTLVETAKRQFGLGTVAAVDITAAVAKFSTAAGASSKAAELMAAALELGAASGQTAAEVAEGLSSALAGNDEWLNRLGLSNPSVIWEKYRAANGLAKDQMDDTTKALALMTEIMDAGNTVAGTYSERMQSGAGEQEKLNNRFDDAKKSFGEAIDPLRIFVVQGLVALLNVIGPVVTGLGYLASGVLTAVIGPFKLAYTAVGGVIEVLGKLTSNKEMEAWGKNASGEFERFTDGIGKWLGVAKPATEQTEKMGKAHELAAVKITASKDAKDKNTDASKRAAEAYEKEYRLYLDTLKLLYEGALTTTQVMEKLRPAVQASFEPQRIKTFNDVMDKSRQLGDELMVKMRGIRLDPPQLSTFDTLKKGIKDNADELVGMARGVLDVAQAFGGISRESASALTSVINIGSSIAKMATGNPIAGITGILGGVANIVGVMMGGDAERRRLMKENNVELARLRDEIGNLSLDVSGEDFLGIQGALQEVLPNLRGGRGAANQADVINALTRRGLSWNDLKKLADSLGIKITSESGAMSVDGIRQLFEAMGLVEIGQFGQDFGSQMESTQAGFGVRGTSDIGQISALGNLGGQFSNALRGIVDVNDLAGTRARLAALFERLNNGGVSAAELGGLTGTQFLDLITNLIGRIDNLQPSASDDGGTTSPTPPGPTETPEEKATRERAEARKNQLDALDLKVLQAEEVLDNLRGQPQTEAVKTQIKAIEALITAAREEERRLRRRFQIEDITGNYAPIEPAPAPAPPAPAGEGDATTPLPGGTGPAVPVETIQSVIQSMDANLSNILTEHTMLHERIAAATEGSYERLISIDEKMDTLIAVSAGTDRIDRALEAERYALSVQQGRGVTF